MESARSVSSAALAGTAVLFFALCFASCLFADQTAPGTKAPSAAAKKKPTKTVAARAPAGTSKTALASKAHVKNSRSREAASTGTKRVGSRRVVFTRKLVHGHWVRTARIIHAAGPTYQTHPDPQRYQQIQQALASDGYFKGEVNGQWGDDSIAALKQFQTDHKLVNDGKISSLSLIGLGLGPDREASVKPASKDTADSVASPAIPAPADPPHN